MSRRTRKSGLNTLVWVGVHALLSVVTGGVWLLFLVIRFLIRNK